MLDLNSRWAKVHFAMEEQFRAITEAGHQMTAQSVGRLDTFKGLQPHLAALRLLNRQHCGNTLQAGAAIDALASALEAIAQLGTEGDKALQGKCPVCGRALELRHKRPGTEHCKACYAPARKAACCAWLWLNGEDPQNHAGFLSRL